MRCMVQKDGVTNERKQERAREGKGERRTRRMREQTNEREKERNDKMEGEEHVSSVARPWTYITRKRPTGRGERKKERGGSRKRTKCYVDGVLRIKNEG